MENSWHHVQVLRKIEKWLASLRELSTFRLGKTGPCRNQSEQPGLLGREQEGNSQRAAAFKQLDRSTSKGPFHKRRGFAAAWASNWFPVAMDQPMHGLQT